MRRLLAFLLALQAGCGGGASISPVAPAATPTPPPKAAIEVTVNLPPVRGSAGGSAFTASWTVAIRETAGVAATVNFVNTTLRDAESGATPASGNLLVQGRAEVTAAAGSDRIPALGTLTVPGSLTYSLLSHGRSVSLTTVVQATDDNGNFVTGVGHAESQ